MSAVNKRQLRMLAPFLEGDRPTHANVDRETGETTREWNLVCPLHNDTKRSASLNIDKGLFFCNVCGGMPITSLIKRADEWQTLAGGNTNGRVLHLDGSPPTKERVELSEAMIDGWHSALLGAPGALQWLKERRGIDLDTVRQFRLGYRDGRLFTIPVFSDHNEIWNVRYYDPSPADLKRKIWSESGYGSPNRLFPISVLVSDPAEVLIEEGEWDTILTLQYMYDAVTRTGAADVWLMEWGQWFKDRTVFLAHDADTKGQHANKVVGDALYRIADVRKLVLPYPIQDKHGPDMTDVILDHGPEMIQELKDKAKPYNKKKFEQLEEDEHEVVTVLDTFDSTRVGQPVKVVVTIKGRREPGYSVPKTLTLACTQDAGAKCNGCPMKAAGGMARMTIEPDDPQVLAMMDTPSHAINQQIAFAYGVPAGKCGKLQVEIEEHQAVEVLFARPALDFTDGASEAAQTDSHTNLTITSVGRHNTLSSSTVAAVGALQPNPKSQRNEFLAHEIEVLETSVDHFEINDRTVELMQRFQASGRPLEKLAEINRSLAEHVTHIAGRPQMHAMMDLTFHSILQWSFAEQFVERGWLECLALGDTRTGKSQVMKAFVGHYGAGEIISCEAATFAGIVGGVQQLGGKDWAVTWGVIPLGDRRLVGLDEAGGMTQEEIAQLSDVRSSGQAKLIKVVQEVTWARTRLIWSANPRNSSMANYTYGVDAIKPLIGNMEDIARFDLAMVVTLSDVPSEVINRPPGGGELVYTSEACHALLMWCWSRKPEHVIWDPDAEQAVFDAANQMGKMYVEDPPLVQAANIRIKIARVAVALAGRLFSTDDTCENVVVKPAHVRDAMAFLNLLYGMQTFGYRERSRERLSDRAEAESKRDEIEQYLKGRPNLAKHLRSAGKFRRQDIEEIMNISREEANGIISTLLEARMCRKVLGDVVVEPTLHALLREVKW